MNDSKKDKAGIADIINKVVSVGVGAAFMTEESVKSLLGDLPLPKDIVNGLVQNAKGAKEDFSKNIREEFGKYLSKVDVEKLVDYIAENYDLKADISLKKKPGSKKSE